VHAGWEYHELHWRQIFSRPLFGDHWHGPQRPNKTVPAPYKAANSSRSNLGPTSQALIDRDKDDAEKLKENTVHPV
jgi:K+-transporting ATPase c subunit